MKSNKENQESNQTWLSDIKVGNEFFLQTLNTEDDSVTISDQDGKSILFFDSHCNVYWCLEEGKQRLMGKIRTSDFYIWEFIFEDSDNILSYVPNCNVEMVARFHVNCADYTVFERTLFQFLYPNLGK